MGVCAQKVFTDRDAWPKKLRDHCPRGSCYAITAAMSKASNENAGEI